MKPEVPVKPANDDFHDLFAASRNAAPAGRVRGSLASGSPSNPSVAVVCGGTSPEAGVSRKSGRSVADALKTRFPKTCLLELDDDIVENLKSSGANVVFPALHGPPGEDGTFQGFLEIIGLPYVGSGVHASVCAMDKIAARHRFREAGLTLAQGTVACRHDGARKAALKVFEILGINVVVKPSRQGSAIGVAFPKTIDDLETSLEAAFAYDDRILVEERIEGREITVGILERDGVKALPVIEIRTPTGAWYDFEHRYTPGYSEHIIPAPIPEKLYRRTQEIAIRAHLSLGCRDLSRVDFVLPEQGDPVVLEVNSLPGMTPTSLYPDAAEAAGIPFADLAVLLIDNALRRS